MAIDGCSDIACSLRVLFKIFGPEKKNSPNMSSLFKDMWKNSTIKSSLVHKYAHGHTT